jgi:hypothetical protein
MTFHSTPLSGLLRASATIASFSAVLFATCGHADAVILQVNGIDYDVEIYAGSYDDQPGFFATPANGGRMPWWGNTALAGDLAFALADGLSPSPLPATGPLFATSYIGGSPADVAATSFDLSTLGITDVINEGILYSAASSQQYAVLAAPVPAPLPIFGAAAAFATMRRLRRQSTMLASHRNLLN